MMSTMLRASMTALQPLRRRLAKVEEYFAAFVQAGCQRDRI